MELALTINDTGSDLAAMILELTANIVKLPQHDWGFASSLINQFSRKGDLSPNQWPYVRSLLAKAKGEIPAGPVAAEVGDLSGLLNLFKAAGTKLKYPKIRLLIGQVGVVLSVAGERSKAPGSINIAGEGRFDDRTWYGRVSPEGKFDPSRSLTPAFSAVLVPVLEKLSRDPAAAVREYGKLTGHCMFCSLPLYDDRSIAAGFGETCAKNWGLHDEWKEAAKK